MRVLVVEDDLDLIGLLSFTLSQEGHVVVSAEDTAGTLAIIETAPPDVVVLDINLGATSGFDVLGQVRQRSAVPVIMLTARTSVDDTVRGLEMGADDYVTKPFDLPVLLARIHAAARRAGHDPAAVASITNFEVGPIRMEVATHTVTVAGNPINLTVNEFRLLQYLLRHAGTVVSTGDLLRHVWGHRHTGGNELVRTAVYRLRGKLGDSASQSRLLHTIPGVGFMLKPVPDDTVA